MKRTVRIAAEARLDLERLSDFLVELSPRTADRAMGTIENALEGLSDFAMMGPADKDSLRKLPIRFGRSGYVAVYWVMEDEIVVTRIFHMREHR